jgi:hypothetical protein
MKEMSSRRAGLIVVQAVEPWEPRPEINVVAEPHETVRREVPQFLAKVPKPELSTRSKSLLGVVFALLVVYQAVGIFPLSPVEGDSLGIANGAVQAASSRLGPQPLAYRYSLQSGTYALVVAAHKISGLDTITAFSLLSAFCSVLFIFTSAALLRQVTACPFPVCGIVVLLFQEAFTGGYYANSTVIAAAFAVLALYILTLGNQVHMQVIAGVLLGLGVWARSDAILIAPACLALLLRGNLKQTILRTALVAFVTIAVALTAILLSGNDFNALLQSTTGYFGTEPGSTPGLGIPLLGTADLKSHLAFFSILLLSLMVFGLIYLARASNWTLLGIFLLGVMPFFVVYAGRIASPKYMYYLLPFFCVPVLSALRKVYQFSTRRRALYSSVVIGLLLIQYIVGLRVSFVTKPYVEEPYPTLLNLFTAETRIGTIERTSLALGAGTVVPTDDRERLSSGILFAPLTWYHNKSLLNAELAKLRSYLQNPDSNPLNVLTTHWHAKQLALNILLNDGYDCQTRSPYVCTKEDQVVLITHRPYVKRTYDEIRESLSLIEAPRVVFVATTALQQYLFLKHATDWTEISDIAFEVDPALLQSG